MRVCMLATSAPRWRGDHASPFIFDLARHFVREGMDTVLVAPRGPMDDGSPTPVREEWENVAIRRFRYFFRRGEIVAYRSGIPANLRNNPVRVSLLAPLFALGFGRAARRAAGTCDIVHANWMISAMIARWFTRRLPVVVTVHENNIAGMLASRAMGRVWLRALARADAVVAPSSYQAECLLRHGVPERDVHVIPCGINLPDTVAQHPGNGRQLLWVGRVAPEKDVPTLITAFAQVLQGEPAARLTLVGDGPDLAAVRQLVSERGLSGQVAIEGWRAPEEVAEYYAAADVVVVSSRSEAGPIVVMEGMAHGLPVISTPVGIVPSVITDGENGILVPAGDANAMATAILSVIRDSERMTRLGAAARRKAEGLTWGHAARQYKSLFSEVLAASQAEEPSP